MTVSSISIQCKLPLEKGEVDRPEESFFRYQQGRGRCLNYVSQAVGLSFSQKNLQVPWFPLQGQFLPPRSRAAPKQVQAYSP